MPYTVSSGSRFSYTEGSYVTFTWRMEGPGGVFLRNSNVLFDIVGLSAADVVGGKLSGSVRTDNYGTATLRIQLSEDKLTEGDETFFIRSNANKTTFSSNVVTVFDTSLGAPPPKPNPVPSPVPTPKPSPVPPPEVDKTHTGTIGADKIKGTNAKDTFKISGGKDEFDGGGGIDTFDLSNLYSVFKAAERAYLGRELKDTYSDIVVRTDLNKTIGNVDIATSYTAYQLFGVKVPFVIYTNLSNIENLIGSQFNDDFKGNGADNWFGAGSGRDTLMGFAGNDTLDGGDGEDLIDGGDGVDTAVFSGAFKDYQFSRSGSDRLEVTRTVNGKKEIDTLVKIEKVQFADKTVEFSALLPPAVTHKIVALSNTVDEGKSARFEVQVTGYPSGKVFYSVSGVSYEDLSNMYTSGTVSVDGTGRGILELMIANDKLTEGPETLSVKIGDSVASITIQDTSVRGLVFGTDSSDTLYGTRGNDHIDAKGGLLDKIYGLDGNDTLKGGAGIDSIFGDSGDDSLLGGIGDDFLDGGVGNDTLLGEDGDDKIDGGLGADVMWGGRGSDEYKVDNVLDQVIEENSWSPSESRTDHVLSSVSYKISDNIENLTLIGGWNAINGTGNSLANKIVGNIGNNSLSGEDGNDSIHGGDGDDLLLGGLGSDILEGQLGRDKFVFSRVEDSKPDSKFMDIIADFKSGIDLIDLSLIDANSGTPDINEAFRFLSSAPLKSTEAIGAVWFKHGILYASVDSSIAPELAIWVSGDPKLLVTVPNLYAYDLVL